MSCLINHTKSSPRSPHFLKVKLLNRPPATGWSQPFTKVQWPSRINLCEEIPSLCDSSWLQVAPARLWLFNQPFILNVAAWQFHDLHEGLNLKLTVVASQFNLWFDLHSRWTCPPAGLRLCQFRRCLGLGAGDIRPFLPHGHNCVAFHLGC